jgi:hypothetical protein
MRYVLIALLTLVLVGCEQSPIFVIVSDGPYSGSVTWSTGHIMVVTNTSGGLSRFPLLASERICWSIQRSDASGKLSVYVETARLTGVDRRGYGETSDPSGTVDGCN